MQRLEGNIKKRGIMPNNDDKHLMLNGGERFVAAIIGGRKAHALGGHEVV